MILEAALMALLLWGAVVTERSRQWAERYRVRTACAVAWPPVEPAAVWAPQEIGSWSGASNPEAAGDGPVRRFTAGSLPGAAGSSRPAALPTPPPPPESA